MMYLSRAIVSIEFPRVSVSPNRKASAFCPSFSVFPSVVNHHFAGIANAKLHFHRSRFPEKVCEGMFHMCQGRSTPIISI